jgi:hypothetical protein
MARPRFSPWERRSKWVEIAVLRELRQITDRWGQAFTYVYVLADRRPYGCPRKRWARFQREKRMGRLA